MANRSSKNAHLQLLSLQEDIKVAIFTHIIAVSPISSCAAADLPAQCNSRIQLANPLVRPNAQFSPPQQAAFRIRLPVRSSAPQHRGFEY